MELFDITIPAGTNATMSLPDPYLLNYYEQAQNRILWLDAAVDDTCTELIKKILWWNAEDNDQDIPVEQRKPIKLMLLSPGGDLYVMLSVMDAVLMSKTPVYTVAVSLAASAACSILLAGSKRFAFPHAYGMWHSGSAGVEGTMEQVQAVTGHLDRMTKAQNQYFLDRTKVDPKLLKRMKDKDWYFNAEEMLEYGIVDRIVENLDEVI
jgi:ATP-dependent Clp protease protease subunit